MSKPQPVPIRPPESKEPEYEQKNVHEVYEVIAEHFSDTRYKVTVAFFFFVMIYLNNCFYISLGL